MTTLKILVVDDEPGIRSGVLRILTGFTVTYPFMDELYTYDVYEASTGEEGLEKIVSLKPDIVLLDNKLPGIQGVDVLAQIRKMDLDLVVVMITSYASIDIAVNATRNGAIDFIPKPFTPQELKSSIENITKQQYLRKITNRMKDEGKMIRYQFLSVLSHELKAPINAVEGYLRIMQQKQEGEHIEDYSVMIDRSLQRLESMRNLIIDLLDFTKIRLERKEGKITNVNLENAATAAITTVQPAAIQKDISITLTASDNATIMADPADIDIILNNLISNAVKYNRDGGSVNITIECSDKEAIIIFADTGIGMSETEREQLFHEFGRIRNEKTRNITGSGLGLFIVKKVLDLYKGTIEVKSEQNRGSEFKLLIPKTI